MNTNKSHILKWRFDISTFRLIGRDLITDRVTALFELVKNCYDANAQNVTITFKDGSTAVHSLLLGSMRPGRSIWIQGTLGEMEGWIGDGEFRLYQYDKKTSGYKATTFNFKDTEGETGGHFGGDRGLVADFCDLMDGVEPSISCTSINDSIWGHLVCYAADKSQKRGEKIII